MEEHEVIIVGAGPAGTACAKALVENGIDVLGIEKEALPRNKICSGVLFGQSQVLLKQYFNAVPSKEVYCNPDIIRADNIQEWNSKKGFFNYIWEISKNGQKFPSDYYNIWRNKFDYWLLQQSGACYRQNCALRNFNVQNNGVRIEVLQRDKTKIESDEKEKAQQELFCSILVAADGGNSLVHRLLNPSWSKDTLEIFIYQAYNRFSDLGGLTDGHWNVFFEPHVGDMLCCIHRKDDFLTLCVGGFKARNLKESMQIFKNFLTDNFKTVFAQEERVEGCVMRLGPPDLGTSKVILTGEAAGIIYLNGEGISAAIDSGYRAGKAIVQALKEGSNVADIYKQQTSDILRHIRTCSKRMHFLSVP